MPSVRRSAILSGNQAVAEIAEGPVFWLDETLPDIVIIVSWDTGGYVDWSAADGHPHLYIARYGSEVHLADLTGVSTNVNESKGEQRFPFTKDSGDDTAGGLWNNITDPLTVAMPSATYPVIGVGGTDPLTVGEYIYIGTELLLVTVIAGNNVTFARGQLGSTTAAHADAVSIFNSFNPFTTPGQYIAQVRGIFSGKTHRTQRFLIEVLDSVPSP